MPTFGPTRPLEAVKERLGPLEFLDFRGLDLVTAHRKLGETVKAQAQKVLRRKLDHLSHEQFIGKIGLARAGRRVLEEKLQSPQLAGRLQQALHEYLACLSAWAAGVGLENFQHGLLQGERELVSAVELALFLQNDNVGCQTGVYRDKAGAVMLWHTEEDVEAEPGSRFDKLRLATFHTGDDGSEINAFIYPDLLPGPAFGWRRDGFLQAVDSLPLKPAAGAYMLANIAAWVTLRLGKAFDPETVIAALGPFYDGYALTTVRLKDEQVLATKVEFAGDQQLVSALDSRPGSYLFQVNIFSDEKAAVALAYEDTERDSRSGLEQRLTRTTRALKSLHLAENAPACLSRLLASRLGGDYAYANEDVKSYFLGKLSGGDMEIYIGSGPALKEDLPRIVREQF